MEKNANKQTDRHTDRHFRIYISRDEWFKSIVYPLILNDSNNLSLNFSGEYMVIFYLVYNFSPLSTYINPISVNMINLSLRLFPNSRDTICQCLIHVLSILL